MRTVILFLSLCTMFSTTWGAPAGAEKSCGQISCPAGSWVVTYASKAEPYFACPTRELSDYVGTVIGFFEMGASLGQMPNISPSTGEPEYDGETKQIIDTLRSRAKVATLDEAISYCVKGKNAVRLMVVNNEKSSLSMWVINPKNKESSWIFRSSADLVKK